MHSIYQLTIYNDICTLKSLIKATLIVIYDLILTLFDIRSK
jgi:hypothetical protein